MTPTPIPPGQLIEPIPGYRLLEPLGKGGFGEVWKVEAPGGMLKAIKFVYGDIQKGQEEGVRVELAALNRVKMIRHPYILSLDRADIINGRLLIVMELADRNLMDRYQECVSLGLPGIPRRELLRCMEEAAEALDLMNLDHGLQHLDIKPQNLFLIHNHIKVADFGQVMDLGAKNQADLGVTPHYCSPEVAQRTISPFADQYSLAIVYQQLLTGVLPFTGTTIVELMLKHVYDPPDLTPLPRGDRSIIARALAKKPEGRFPSCSQLVRALQGGETDALNELLAEDVPSRPRWMAPPPRSKDTDHGFPQETLSEMDLPEDTDPVRPPKPPPRRKPGGNLSDQWFDANIGDERPDLPPAPARQSSAMGLLVPVGGGQTVILDKEHLIVGRSHSTDIRLRDSDVSSRHCELELLDGIWYVRDLASKNGIRVNGKRVLEQALNPGDELAIATLRFRVQYQQPRFRQ